jgi:hypothetical protein
MVWRIGEIAQPPQRQMFQRVFGHRNSGGKPPQSKALSRIVHK